MPEHDIGIFDRPVLLDEIRNTAGTIGMVHVFACGIAFFRVVFCDPEMVFHEVRADAGWRIWFQVGGQCAFRHDLIANGLAGMVGFEPPRILRRLLFPREWSHDEQS
jgi:hypothetical protein